MVDASVSRGGGGKLSQYPSRCFRFYAAFRVKTTGIGGEGGDKGSDGGDKGNGIHKGSGVGNRYLR